MERLPVIHRALYLLFNQGYHGGSQDSPVQPLLCREAIRLATMLLDHPNGRTTETYALAALMHLHAARLPAKLSLSGDLTQLLHQDRALWDQPHIQSGFQYLRRASSGQALTEFHIEALIAAVHASAPDLARTDWPKIVTLYDALLRLNSSPVIALNRAIAISQADGPARGLAEIALITGADRLEAYPFYWAALGEMQSQVKLSNEARASFEKAIALARNPAERGLLTKRRESV